MQVLKNPAQYREVFVPLLKEIRLSKGLTQLQVATRLDAPQSYVSKYETGERRLDFVETVLVCKALGTTIENFAAVFSKRLRGASGRQAANE